LLKNIATLLMPLFLMLLVSKKIKSIFPGIEAMGWFILGVFFVAVTALGVALSGRISQFAKFNEDHVQWITVIVLMVLAILSAYLLRNQIAPFFGTSIRP
jgi:hypothetical protein